MDTKEPIRKNRVRELRENRLMTQAQLARKAKVALRTIHSVEKGMNCRMDTKRKILLALGNVEGVGEVEDRITVTAPAVAPARFVTVKKGDTLSAIAKAEYGNANAYMKIFEANKPMLSHPDKIYPGQVLRIPE